MLFSVDDLFVVIDELSIPTNESYVGRNQISSKNFLFLPTCALLSETNDLSIAMDHILQ